MSSPTPALQDAGAQARMHSNGHFGGSPKGGPATHNSVNGDGGVGRASPALGPSTSNGYSSLEVPAIPPLRTSVSLTHMPARQVTRPGAGVVDWRPSVSDKEREDVRKNIKDAYLRNARSVEEMLQLVMALEEEFLYQLAPSRLDYIKNTIQFERRLAERKRQLSLPSLPSSLLTPLFARQPSSLPTVPPFSSSPSSPSPSPSAAAAIERVLLNDPNAAALIAQHAQHKAAKQEQQLTAIRQVEEREREEEEGQKRAKRDRRTRGHKEEEEEEEGEGEGEGEGKGGPQAKAGTGKRTRK